jgi:hypothetical protein
VDQDIRDHRRDRTSVEELLAADVRHALIEGVDLVPRNYGSID